MLLRGVSATIVASAFLVGCGPQIRSFDVRPRTLCQGDQPHLTYQVRGTPALYLRFGDAHAVARGTGAASAEPDTVEFKLVVTKGSDTAVRSIAIVRFGDTARTSVVLSTALHGDTIVAAGSKNPARWGNNIEISSIASGSARSMEARHAGKVVQLDSSGTPSRDMAGLPVEGDWELRSVLAANTRPGVRAALASLAVNVTLRCGKNH